MLIRYPDNPKASLIHSRAEKQAEEQEEREKYCQVCTPVCSIINSYSSHSSFGDFSKTGPVNGNEFTSGVQLAAILAGSVTTNTYPSIKELIVLSRWYPSPDHDGDNTMKAKNTAIKLVL